MKFLCEQCKAKYQIADEKAAGKTVRMKCRKCGYLIEVRAAVTETSGVGGGAGASEVKVHSSSRPPAGQAPSPGHTGTAPAAPKAAQKPAPPRAASP
ncbi:MAG TPA: zinc-ribbon domain-containing protein, partial [Polyangiaceae bacterium]